MLFIITVIYAPKKWKINSCNPMLQSKEIKMVSGDRIFWLQKNQFFSSSFC
jgi:hypothetical protein